MITGTLRAADSSDGPTCKTSLRTTDRQNASNEERRRLSQVQIFNLHTSSQDHVESFNLKALLESERPLRPDSNQQLIHSVDTAVCI